MMSEAKISEREGDRKRERDFVCVKVERNAKQN